MILLRTTVKDVEGWIKELKIRGIKESRYRDLPKDLKKIRYGQKGECNISY